jgi:hypothetical protein
LTHILSEADQCLNHAQPWAEQQLQTLRSGTGQRVYPPDLSGDRLVGRLRHWTRTGETAWRARLAKAQAALAALNERGWGKRRCTARPAR